MKFMTDGVLLKEMETVEFFLYQLRYLFIQFRLSAKFMRFPCKIFERYPKSTSADDISLCVVFVFSFIS